MSKPLRSIKQQIPIYCYHTKLGPAGLCRICMVEIEGMPKLQIACNTVATDGMVVRTQGEKVDEARAVVLELFLVNHPLDCPICDKGGECDLQDYAMAYARGTSDVADPKLDKPKAVDLGPTIVLDEERCIVCQRCVRFDDIIADQRQLVVKDRGARDIIATATGVPYRHNFTGNVTELCPVGALTSKTYRFKSRPWDLERTQTTCTQCAVGCQQFADVRYGTLLRTMLVEEDEISDGWLCDRGRYNVGFYESPDRITQPLYRKDGGFVQIGWDDAFILWAKAIRDAIAARGTGAVGAIGGGRLTNEEAFVLQHLFRTVGVSDLDWRGGAQRQATPGTNAAPLDAIDRAQAIVIIGASPEERAPVLWLRIHKAALRSGAKIVRASTAQEARSAAGDASRVALIWDGVDLERGRSYAEAFAGIGELSTYIASEQANARGAEAMGMLPSEGPAVLDGVRRRKICGAFDLRCESGAQRAGCDDHRCRARSYSVLGRERALSHRNRAARGARVTGEGCIRKGRDHARRGRQPAAGQRIVGSARLRALRRSDVARARRSARCRTSIGRSPSCDRRRSRRQRPIGLYLRRRALRPSRSRGQR